MQDLYTADDNSGTSVIDGLDVFLNLFESEDACVRHVIRSIMFFSGDVVREQSRIVRHRIRTGEAIPVRYTSNKSFFHQHRIKTTTPSFRSKKEAVAFTNDPQNTLFHRDTKIRVCFDRDGNYYPKQEIYNFTGHVLGRGDKNTIVNYVIAHIWDKTNNPLYFSLLWNYCMIPCHCVFLTDKRDDSHPVVRRIKNLIKAISIELYNPNRIMDWNQDVIGEEEMPEKDYQREARLFVKENGISFLPVMDKS